jgi:hypothetical protein
MPQGVRGPTAKDNRPSQVRIQVPKGIMPRGYVASSPFSNCYRPALFCPEGNTQSRRLRHDKDGSKCQADAKESGAVEPLLPEKMGGEIVEGDDCAAQERKKDRARHVIECGQ